MHAKQWRIFYRGSVTYFFSSLLFPRATRDKVGALYAFVRTADDFVDATPPQRDLFYTFKSMALGEIPTEGVYAPILKAYASLAAQCDFSDEWTRSFLEAMESDLAHVPCKTIEDTTRYMYGSAEVIGLMMARIMELPDQSLPSAQLLGRSMQYINFIRDIAEDNALGRQYLPQSLLAPYGIADTSAQSAHGAPDAWRACIIEALDTYRTWQEQAEDGYAYIPWRLLVPIKTAADMYAWTAREIARDPMVVFDRKIKPSPYLVLKTGIRNAMYFSLSHKQLTV